MVLVFLGITAGAYFNAALLCFLYSVIRESPLGSSQLAMFAIALPPVLKAAAIALIPVVLVSYAMNGSGHQSGVVLVAQALGGAVAAAYLHFHVLKTVRNRARYAAAIAVLTLVQVALFGSFQLGIL